MTASTSATEVDRRVAFKQLDQVYARLRLSTLLTMGISLLFAGLLVPYFPADRLLVGLLGIQAVGAARYLLWRSYVRAQPSQDPSELWRRRFLVGAIAAGASWAFTVVVLMPPAGRPETALLLVMILAVCSVATATLAAQFAALLGFLTAALVPTIGVALVAGGPVEAMAAAATFAALLCQVAVGYQSNVATTRHLRTEFALSASIQETSAARAAAELSNRAKSRFLANMSHEVRTPLNGILGMVEVLAQGTLDAQQRRRVGLLRQSAQHLLAIVNEILDLSKIEEGRIELDPIDFDVGALVQEVVALLRPNAERAGLRLDVDIETGFPRRVIADPLRVRQVLLNLLSNAVKFTEQGFVRLHARHEVVAGTSDELRLWFEVVDSGIGIAPADTARIFEAFTQTDESASRRFGGTGLGLTLSRRLAELMGGALDCESRPGEGSTFRFGIPVRRVCEASAAPASPALPAHPPAFSARVLLVEDNPVNVEVAVALLESLGAEVVCATDGREALERALPGAFDLVFMDCQMPVMDGYTAARELRRRACVDRHGHRLPIVALTAGAFDEDRRQAGDSGMDDFLSKPVSTAALAQALHRWVSRHPPGRAPVAVE